jgi:hypothetical protein
LVTMANAPPRGRDGEAYNSDLQKCAVEYFCFRGLTSFRQTRSDLPDRAMCL